MTGKGGFGISYTYLMPPALPCFKSATFLVIGGEKRQPEIRLRSQAKSKTAFLNQGEQGDFSCKRTKDRTPGAEKRETLAQFFCSSRESRHLKYPPKTQGKKRAVIVTKSSP